MYQTVGHDAIHLQAECFPVPFYREYITGDSVDQTLNYTTTANDETEDLFHLLSRVKEAQPEIEGLSVGAILSNYQRTRVENVCTRLGLTSLAYLWHRVQKELLAEVIEAGLTAVIIKVAAIGMAPSWRCLCRVEERTSRKDVRGNTAYTIGIGKNCFDMSHCRMNGLIYMFVVRVESMRLL